MFCPTVVKRNLMFNSHCKGQRQHTYSGCCNRRNCANIRNLHEEMGTGSLCTQRLSGLKPFLCEILIVECNLFHAAEFGLSVVLMVIFVAGVNFSEPSSCIC